MQIRLGTFNLYQFVEPPYSWYTKKEKFNEAQWLEKTTWIKNQIVKMDCDIMGFQEVFSRKALKALVKELGFNYFKVVDVAKLSKNNRQKYVTTTVAIASKYPIANVQAVEAHRTEISDDTFKFSRIPIKAMITLPNKQDILVYVCHLKSNRLNAFEHVFNVHHTMQDKKELIAKDLEHKSSASLKQRLFEASSLFFDIAQYKKQSTVLLCDLNDKEFSLTIDVLTNHTYHDETNSEQLLLHDASYEYTQEVYNPHPDAKEPTRKATSYFLGKGNVLDYIFISSDLREQVSDFIVFDGHLEDNKDGSLLTSDHAQVVCELTIP